MILFRALLLCNLILLSSGLPTLLFNYGLPSKQPYLDFFSTKTSPDFKYKKFRGSQISREDFTRWLDEQKAISFQNILNNIGGLGKSIPGVAQGAVIASPSKNDPNYFYQWVRDAAITMNSLVEFLADNGFNDDQFQLQPVIESYIENAYYIQRVSNPSGTFDDLSGLGEPKFMPDNTPFEANWGRPQRDGPGLRAITVANYLNLLDSCDKHILNNTLLESELWVYENIVKNDLQYIIRYWDQEGFDLWEEVYAKHLFTSLTQLKALAVGIRLSEKYEDQDFMVELERTFITLRSFIELAGFQNPNLPYLVETPSLLYKNVRNGLDIATILASIRSHDLFTVEDAVEIPFDVNDPYVLNTLTALVNDMKYRYPINHKRLGLDYMGVALGRYPEDVYNGNGLSEGNPWFIATATASEVLYKILYALYQNEQDVDLNSSLLYRSMLIQSPANGTIEYGTKEFEEFAINLTKYADSFLDVIREHVDNNGAMSEQFNKYSGYMEGAENLTWSYGSLWSSFRWRNKVIEKANEKGFSLVD